MNSSIFNKDVDTILMCKNTAIYNVDKNIMLVKNLMPGSVLKKTRTYKEWMRSRYSVGSNTSARRLMMRAFGTDNHGVTLKDTRALSLSDCYWLKQENEDILFEDVTPYLNEEWGGTDKYSGGSISTLFVNGAASKKWDNKNWLRKLSSKKEAEVYELCHALEQDIPKFRVEGNDLLVENFTSVDVFLESFDQTGIVGEFDNHIVRGIEELGENFVKLITIDYLVEHDDRHSGNFGFLRDSNTGEYLGMSPFYDFDWCWSSWSNRLPDIAFEEYSETIYCLCKEAINKCIGFPHETVINNRATQLIDEINKKN